MEVEGAGVPVLFVHGFPLDRRMWRHQQERLSRCQRIVPDLRGVGASSAPAGGYSMGRYADDLVTVLDAVAVRRAVVCGLSMGGYVAFELVRRHADRLAGLILCDTRAEADSAEARGNRDALIGLAEREGVRAVGERFLPKLLAPTTFAQQPELVVDVREMMGRLSLPGVVGALRAMRDRPDSTALLPTIRVPTLVIVGEEDQVTPVAGVERMAAAIPGAGVVRIPAAGHLAPLEQPGPTTSAIGDFLTRLA